MNILSNLQQIANIMIRPSRYTYKMTDLGNKSFKLDDKIVIREDFQLKNPRGMRIKCSLYTSCKDLKDIEKLIIYLHCNSGCRVEGLAYLKLALQQDFSYLVFDFTGSGLSDGKYVSLGTTFINQFTGFYETVDLQCVYLHIKQIISEKAKIIIWGRSMGAVTGIFQLISKGLNFLLQDKHDVFMAIFDSPFKSLRQLFVQIGRQKTSFPDFILEMAYNYLKPIVQEKALFDIEKVDLKLQNSSITCPGVFVASKQDSLVPFEQIDEIFKLYKGEKEMLFIEQGHNEARNIKVISDIFKAIKKQFQTQELSERMKLQKEKQKKNFFTVLGNDRHEKKQLSRKKLQLTIKSLSQRQLLTTTIGKIVLLKDQELLQERRQGNNISININAKNQNINSQKLPSQNIPKLRVRQDPLLQSSSSIQKNFPNISIKQQTQSFNEPKTLLQKKPISCLLPQKKSLTMLVVQEEEMNRLSFQQDSQRKLLQNNKSETKLKVKIKPFQIKNFFGNENTAAREKQSEREKDNRVMKNQRQPKDESSNITHAKLTVRRHTQALKQKSIDTNQIINTSRQQTPKSHTIKNFSLILTKPTNPQSPQHQQFNHTRKLKPININLCSQQHNNLNLNLNLINKKQQQQPHSQIKNQSHKKYIHQDFIREKQFLKRCQSLQKVFNVGDIMSNDDSERRLLIQPATHTYREIKCTERVLEKIIQKQERKLLILNLQQHGNNLANAVEGKRHKDKQKEKEKENQQREKTQILVNKERKTLQHIVNKTKPFVELKGIKNYRNSLQGKFKTEIRK